MHTYSIDEREQYMRRAIELAAKGEGHTDPNPLVGAVIVKDGRIIGEGYHEVYGSLHAERNALKNCGEDMRGADMYVTLEPCCHYGKQPPCTLALIEAGIKHVYVGSSDPNPKVAGKGIAQLREAGIDVTEGFLKDECDALNPVFFHYISTNEPYIALKYAMTADGRIATDNGKSQWITGTKAREHVHKLRNRYKGILIGIGTVLADDPMLTCRIDGGRNPVRIVLDTHLRIPLESKLVQSAKEVPLIVVCGSSDTDIPCIEKIEKLKALGAEVIAVNEEQGHVSIPDTLKALGERGINGILVEGGAHINGAFIDTGNVNRIYTYIGARIFGGNALKSPVRGAGFDSLDTALRLGAPKVEIFDEDVLLSYDIAQEERCLQE